MGELDGWVAGLEAALAVHKDPARAVSEKKYLKSELTFLGTGMPVVRKTAKGFVRSREPMERKALRALAERLFASEVYELRSVAIGILELSRAALTSPDAVWLIKLVRASPTWAHVDWLASAVIGPAIGEGPEATRLLTRWTRDEDVWVRRTAILAPLEALRGGGGDFTAFEVRVVPLLEEKEFWIRKAIGWVLREVAKNRPALVAEFAQRHHERMSGLTWREATRTLPAKFQRGLPARRAR